jgi:hypothetical protein
MWREVYVEGSVCGGKCMWREVVINEASNFRRAAPTHRVPMTSFSRL